MDLALLETRVYLGGGRRDGETLLDASFYRRRCFGHHDLVPIGGRGCGQRGLLGLLPFQVSPGLLDRGWGPHGLTDGLRTSRHQPEQGDQEKSWSRHITNIVPLRISARRGA